MEEGRSKKFVWKKNILEKEGIKMKRWIVFLMFLFSLFCYLPKANAGKEEIYVLVNMLVEKGTITSEEGKEIMAAVDNIVKKQKQDAEKNSVKTSAAKNIKIGGLIQTRYDAYEFNGKRDEFNFRRVRTNLSGSIVDNVSFRMEFDLTKGKDNDLLTDAFIKFTNFPKANITLGQFKIPYSEEYLISSSALDTIERSLPVTRMSSEYDRGIMVDGDILEKVLSYGIAVVNGTGGNKTEDNDSKDIVARLVFSPWGKNENALSGLKFGAAYQSGEQKTGANKENRTRSDLMLKYQYKNFKALTEYLNQETKKKGAQPVKNAGYFVQLAYGFPLENDHVIEPVVKYEVYDPDTNKAKDTQTIFTTGLNWYIGKNVKFSTNYRWRNDDKGGKIETNSNEWFSQVQIRY